MSLRDLSLSVPVHSVRLVRNDLGIVAESDLSADVENHRQPAERSESPLKAYACESEPYRRKEVVVPPGTRNHDAIRVRFWHSEEGGPVSRTWGIDVMTSPDSGLAGSGSEYDTTEPDRDRTERVPTSCRTTRTDH